MKRIISVVITTKNEESVILNLLKSIKNQTFKSYEIIVVDNFSSDSTQKIAKKFNSRVFKKGPERSVQRNFGVKIARGEYTLILDADMELTKNVLLDLSKIKEDVAIVPEKSFGEGYWAKVKAYERSFYVGEDTIEAARFFKKTIFEEFNGYDSSITGPEDYDLPYRMRKKGIKIGRIKNYILHNERKFSPLASARKKFYYASKASFYLKKHPEVAVTQGNMVLRPVFFKKWRKLVSHPTLSLSMFFLKGLEMGAAMLGFASGLIKAT